MKAFGVFVLPIARGFVIVCAGIATYWGLEVLLASYTDHDRCLWEGGAVALVINGGLALANLVLRRVGAKREEDLS